MKEVNSSHEFNRAPEFGARGREFSRSRENNPEVGKNDGGREQNTSSAKEPRRKKRSVADRIRRAMVCVAGAAVVTVAIILPANGPKAEFTGLSVTDTSISYEIEVPQTGMQVTLVAENDFTRREAALSVGPNFGTIEGLVPGMSYSLKVVGKSGVISLDMAQKSVTTDTVAPVTTLYSVESECKCNVDGYRHIFLWTLFSGGGDFAPLPALLRFMTSKGAFTIIFAPNSVNLRGVRVQGF